MILLVTMLLNCIPAFAIQKEPYGNFYVYSETVPDSVSEYISQSIGEMIAEYSSKGCLKVSVPFKLNNAKNDLYYSVVYCNNSIIGTYRVFEIDGELNGIFSENEDLINGLNSISGVSTEKNPAYLFAGDYDDILAIVGAEGYVVLSDPLGRETCIEAFPGIDYDEMVVNLANTISYRSARSTPSSKFLSTGWSEIQGSLPWCNAYATANIIRFKAGVGVAFCNAQMIMEWAYPELNDNELINTPLSTTKARQYANTWDIYPSYVSYRITYSQVVNEIQSDNPMIFLVDNLTTGETKAHALVCRGYSDNGGDSYYSIWNPWYSRYEKIYTSNNLYVPYSGSTNYRWSATMYQWDY